MKEEVFDSAISSPHFDDRRVIQSAQPVVPLNEIRARQRNRKLWFLSGAFTLAMLLGAASALVTVRIKQMRFAAIQAMQITAEPAPETTAPEAETVAAAPVESPTDMPVTEVAPPVKRVVTPKKQDPALAERPRMVGIRSNEVEPSEEEQLQQIREAVLYDQWQERRMRRAARRERRNRIDRDLSHVDEIFEGPRRPERP
jgi:hypothetical protein